MFGQRGTDWRANTEHDNMLMRKYAVNGIDRKRQRKYYWCEDYPFNNNGKKGHNVYQNPVYIHSKVYKHRLNEINIDDSNSSSPVNFAGHSMGRFARGYSFSLSDFDLSISGKLYEANINITINPNISGAGNMNAVINLIEGRWKGTKVNVFTNPNIPLNSYYVQISAGIW